MKKKRIFLLILMLVSSLLTGCTKDHSNGTSNSSAASNPETTQPAVQAKEDSSQGSQQSEPSSPAVEEGRYIAKDIPFSTDIDTADLEFGYCQGQSYSGHIAEYYAHNRDNTKFYRFCLQNDESWTTEELIWAENSIPSKIAWVQQIYYSSDGTGYLFYYTEDSKHHCIAHIMKQTSETSGEDLNIPYLTKENDNGRYPYPQTLAVDLDGYLYLLEEGSCDVFDPNTLTTLHEYTPGDYIGTLYLTKDSVYFTVPSKCSIAQYDRITGEPGDTYSYDSSDPHSAVLCVNEQDQLCILVREGIFTIKPGNSTWEMIYDGSLGILTDPNIYSSLLIPGSKNDFYFPASGSQPSIFHCFFDEHAPAQPSHTLTVYSLYESDQIRKAASVFQTKYPDYRVSLEIASSAKYAFEREELDASDYIKTLNTELLSNNGSDVLILDDLPYQSYIEKGILSNLYDYVPSLQHPEEFLSNIIDHCKIEDQLYVLPSSFEFYALQGKEDVLNAADSIHSIAEYMQQNSCSSLFQHWNYNDFIELVLNLEADSLFLSNSLMTQEELTQLFTDIRNIQSMTTDGINYVDVENRATAKQYGNDYCRKPEILYAHNVGSPYSNLYFCGLSKVRNCSYRPVNNAFIPELMAGITSASAEKEAAGNFIDILVSADLQKVTNGNSEQPVRLDSLEAEHDENIGVGAGDYSFDFPEMDQRDQVIQLSKTVNKLRPYDKTLSKLYKEILLDYLSNTNEDAESTGSQLYNRLSLYFAE